MRSTRPPRCRSGNFLSRSQHSSPVGSTDGQTGRRAYVQVLQLLESFDPADLHAAVKQALHLGAISFDAVKHLVLCRAERRPPRLDLDIYPYLPRATVEKTSARAYMRLLDREEEPA